jgi:hypothetical protein
VSGTKDSGCGAGGLIVTPEFNGQIIRGRLARSDSDPENRRDTSSPYGIIVLEQLGLTRGPETILQIANIPDDGLCPLDEN